jgi:hypothetical protein
MNSTHEGSVTVGMADDDERMRGKRGLAVAAGLLAVAMVVGLAIAFLVGQGLERASSWATIAGLVVTLVGTAVALRRQLPTKRPPGQAAVEADDAAPVPEPVPDVISEPPPLPPQVKEAVRQWQESSGLGAATQANTGSTTIANIGVIEQLTLWMVTPPEAPTDATDPDPSLAPVRAAYLRWLRQAHQSLDLEIAGATVTRPLALCPPPGPLVSDGSTGHARVVELEHLRSRARQRSGPEAEFATLAERALPTYLTSAGNVDQLDLSGRPTRSPDELIHTVWRAIILGDPGSGKSTLLRRVASEQAAHEPAGDADDGARLPVLCRAAELVGALAGEAAESMERLAAVAVQLGWEGVPPTDPVSGDPIAPDQLAWLARTAARQGRLLLLVDGLDELPTLADRRALAGVLDGAAAADGARLGHPDRALGNQITVTSRVVGYHGSPLSERFQQLLIGPLSREQAGHVTEYWLAGYLATQAVDTPEQDPRWDEVHQVVQEQATRYGGFTSNPYLLVSLISAVLSSAGRRSATRGGRWVRADVYGTMIDDAVRRGTLRYPTLSPLLLGRLQAALAYHLHATCRSGVVDRQALTAALGRALESLDEPIPPAITQPLELVVAGAGLLIYRGQGLYGFRHLTVQEYLAGRWLADGEDADEIADRMIAHIGDPRWLEAVRLALGHLSATVPDRFDGVIDRLLQGPARRLAAELLGQSLADLTELRQWHIKAMVRVALETEAELAATAHGFFSYGVVMIEPLLRWQPSVQGDPAARVVRDELCRSLRAGPPATTAAAARLLDALHLDDREVIAALYAAQEDGTAPGWDVTKALLSALQRHRPVNADTDAAATVRAGLSEEDRALLSRMDAVPPALGPLTLHPEKRVRRQAAGDRPMAAALTGDPALLHHAVTDPAWARVLLCIYGGVPFLGARRWRHQMEQAISVFQAPTTGTADRWRAAVLLDTVILPALDRYERLSISFSPDQIATDSPLTERLVALLRRRAPGSQLPALLAELVANGQADADTRGDALAAWVVAGATEQHPDLAELAVDDEVRRRASWRLARADLLFTDALASVAPSTIIPGPAAGDEPNPDLHADMVRGLGLLGTPKHSDNRTFVRHLREELALAVCGPGEHKTYNVAVLLDTAGRDIADGPPDLAATLAGIPLTETASASLTDDWHLDRLAPAAAELGEAMTTLAGLHHRWGFLRCWFLDRLAAYVTTEEYEVEALCLALEVLPHDPDSAKRTLSRLETAIRDRGAADAPEAPASLKGFEQLLQAIADPYPRLRARLRLSALRGTRWSAASLVRRVAEIGDPHQRLRALELAADLRLVDSAHELLAAALDAAHQIERPVAKARALARLARWTGTEPEAERLRSAAVTALEPATPEETASVLAALPPAATANERRLRQQLETGLPSGRLRRVATGDVIGALLSHEPVPLASGSTPEQAVAWAMLTADLLCRRGLELLRGVSAQFSSERAAWSALCDDRRRTAAIAELRTRAAPGVAPLQLDEVAAAGIDALLTSGDSDDAADLLVASRLAGRGEWLTGWRDGKPTRVADVATLLMLESGQLDQEAVARLPALLAEPNDRVRLRTRAALASVSRGAAGPPRLRASTLGPATLAALVRLLLRLRRERPELYAELMWAVSDIVHDSFEVFQQTLAELGDDPVARRTLLTHLHHLTAPFLDALAAKLPELLEDEQAAVCRGLQATAAHPARYGTEPAQLRRLAPVAWQLAAEGGDEVAQEALRLHGLITAPTPAAVEPLLHEAVAGDTTSAAACEALGFLLSRAKEDGCDLDDSEPVAALWDLARSPDEPVAVKAIGALARIGIQVEESTDVPPELVLRGLIAAVDPFVVGDQFTREVDRASRFLRTAVADRLDEPSTYPRLLHQLIGDIVRQGRELPAQHHTDDLPDRRWETHLDVLLAVLDSATQAQPAALRQAVTTAHPAVPRLLVEILQQDSNWVARRSAGSLLAMLGDGDAPSLRALLNLAWDTDVVRAHVYTALPWLDRVAPAGVDELVRATQDPFLARAHLAVRLLGSLTQQSVLTPKTQQKALTAIAAAAGRPDADRPLLLEQEAGQIRSLGSLGDTCRRAMSSIDYEQNVHRGRHLGQGIALRLADTSGEPVTVMLTSDVPTEPPIHYQLRHLHETERVDLEPELLQGVNRLARAAAQARVPLAVLLQLPPLSSTPTPPVSTPPPPVSFPAPRATGAQESVGVLLLNGRNTLGVEIYAFLELPLDQIDALKTALRSGENFVPSDFGTVLASGYGQPSEEVKDQIGKKHFMVSIQACG